MDEWFAQVSQSVAGDPLRDFQGMASRLRSVPRPQAATRVEAIPEMPLSDVLVVFAQRVLADPLLEAAALRIYSENWLVRQMSGAMYDLIVNPG